MERETDKEKKTMRETQRGRVMYPMCDRIDLKAKRIITQKLGGRRRERVIVGERKKREIELERVDDDNWALLIENLS